MTISTPKTKRRWLHFRLRDLIALAALVCALAITSQAVLAQQKTFPSAEDAVKAAVAAARSNNVAELLAIFGPQSKDLLFSGDPVADK